MKVEVMSRYVIAHHKNRTLSLSKERVLLRPIVERDS